MTHPAKAKPLFLRAQGHSWGQCQDCETFVKKALRVTQTLGQTRFH